MQSKEVVVSVIIPTYNRAYCLEAAIQSALKQTYAGKEIIVVDDGSTDETKSLLAKYSSNVRILHQSNAGVGAARNAGVRAARGEWIAFLDSDDEWIPEKIDVQMRALTQYPRAVAHSTNAEYVSSAGN